MCGGPAPDFIKLALVFGMMQLGTFAKKPPNNELLRP